MTKDMTQNSMSDNKQSSIEWFWNEIGNILPFSVDSATAIKLYDALQQAKAMHKDETKDAYNQGYRDGEMTTDSSRSQVDISEFNDADIYFENTFGGNNEQQ